MIPEFADGAALTIAPGDRDALRGALLRVLRDRDLRAALRAAGPERAKLWRWDRGAAVMTQMLKDAMR